MSVGVDLAALLEGRLASAKGRSVPIGVGYGEGCPLSSRLKGLGSVVSSPSGVRCRAENGFWRILKATDSQNAHFCTYMTKSGGGICISVPRSKFWGDLSPLSPPPSVIYAHAHWRYQDFIRTRDNNFKLIQHQLSLNFCYSTLLTG